jgi:hypothetical protein
MNIFIATIDQADNTIWGSVFVLFDPKQNDNSGSTQNRTLSNRNIPKQLFNLILINIFKYLKEQILDKNRQMNTFIESILTLIEFFGAPPCRIQLREQYFFNFAIEEES